MKKTRLETLAMAWIQRTNQSAPSSSLTPNRAMRRAAKHLSGTDEQTRRDFIKRAAGAGMFLGIPSLLAACGGRDAAPAAPAVVEKTPGSPLFFNLSSETALNKSYFIVLQGKLQSLVPVASDPSVLASARMSNSFLAAVPDDQITHHLEGVVLSTVISPLTYIGSVPDPVTGTWALSSVVQLLNPGSVTRTVALLANTLGAGVLPTSAKRAFYGLGAPTGAQDLRDELALVDPTDHARTLLGLTPDLLCADPDGAHYLHTTYLTDRVIGGFARQLLAKGPATQQMTPDQPNAAGWATLMPVKDGDGVVRKLSNGGIAYHADWSSAVDASVGTLSNVVAQSVKNDVQIGADVTPPATGPAVSPSPNLAYAGKVWYRRDGIAADEGAVPDAGPSATTWTFRDLNSSAGLIVNKPNVTLGGDGRYLVKIDNIENWFLRHLGIFVRFYDAGGTAIPVSDYPSDTFVGDRPENAEALDETTLAYCAILTPPFTVAAIPVYAAETNVDFRIPIAASRAEVYMAGLGLTGQWSNPEGICKAGILMTGLVNYGLVALFMAAGVAGFEGAMDLISQIAAYVAGFLVSAVQDLAFTTTPTSHEISSIFFSLLNVVLDGIISGKVLPKLAAIIAISITAAEIEDEIPLVGQVARASAAIIGALQLGETCFETFASPSAYQFDLNLTHDLNLNLLPDANSTQFPIVPSGYQLFYSVSYFFDRGDPKTVVNVVVPDPTVHSIPLTIKSVPRGGTVTISVVFNARSSTPGLADYVMAIGTTGAVPNLDVPPPDITIEQSKVAIGSSTTYLHQRKTALDAQGHHVWSTTTVAPAYLQPSGGQQNGDLGALRSLTVRQGSVAKQRAGYIGYGWQAYSTGLQACGTGGVGQLDGAANLNTSAGNAGSDAQVGYAITPCGLDNAANGGISMAYDLLGNTDSGYYLDTTSLLIRRIDLATPGFSAIATGQAFGKLNLPSQALLLHPAGSIVSVNNTFHRIEVLPLSDTPLADVVAPTVALARAYSSEGSRPGLMTSPVSAAITHRGVILVLEDSAGNNRIQAFNLGGNAVRLFANQPSNYFLVLAATAGATYVDIATEATGFIYVLSHDDANQFRLDLYHEMQTGTAPISTTRGVNAARLAVDFFRNVYTLNYEVLRQGTAFPAITEPSVSLWTPSLPA